jgi:hypothetical protein
VLKALKAPVLSSPLNLLPCGLTFHSLFDDYPLSYGITKDKDALHFDVILFSGRSRALDFRAMNRACVGFTLEVTDKPDNAAKSSASINGELLEVKLEGEKTLFAAIPIKLGLLEDALYASGEMGSASRGEIDGQIVNDLV